MYICIRVASLQEEEEIEASPVLSAAFIYLDVNDVIGHPCPWRLALPSLVLAGDKINVEIEKRAKRKEASFFFFFAFLAYGHLCTCVCISATSCVH